MSTRGRYLLLEVPHADAAVESSFLRLGGFDSDWESLPGSHLVRMFPRDEEFFDDRRKRDAGPDFREEVDRQAMTADLFTRGGWWDHSGGNRISTTEGDKLEVIRGNYRIAVLGRQLPESETWGESAGFDFSGGVIRDKQRVPGEIYSVEWVPTWGGTRKVTEKTEKGDIDSTFWGNKESNSYGDTFDDTIGSESPGDETPNPDITKKTWAESITGKTGSAKCPVDEIYGSTWALSIQNDTFVLAKSETTQVLAIQSATNAATITKSTVFLNSTGHEMGALKLSATILAKASSLSLLADDVGISVASAAVEVDTCPLSNSLVVGNTIGASIGASIDAKLSSTIGVAVGSKIDVAVRPSNLNIAIAALKLTAFLGIGVDFSLYGFSIKLDNRKLFAKRKLFGKIEFG